MPTEEEIRRKIIIDSQVSAIASRGIGAAASGTLTPEQIARLIQINEQYIAAVRECAPSLCD